MKQGNVWDNRMAGYQVDEFKLTFEDRDWTVRRVTHHDTGDVEYKRRDMNRFHSRFEKVPPAWENAIDRVIDEDKPFKI
jgi:hypothetical protein